MSRAYRIQGLTTAQKAVLVVLCDHANDEGASCYPSMGRIASHASISERTAYRVVKDLERIGYVKREPVPGRSTQFTIVLDCPHPCQIVTPDTMAEAPDMVAEAPDTVSPKPSRTIIEPSKNNMARKPDGVSDGVWQDFQQLRKAKRAPLTETALAAIEREAAAAGWTLEAALSECSARGWQAFKAAWVKETTNGRTAPSNRNTAELALAKLGMAGG